MLFRSEKEEDTEQELTYEAFDRKLRMKAVVWEIQRSEKRSSDSPVDQNTDLDNTKLRFGPPKAGMQAVMEERARRKQAASAKKAALKQTEIEDRIFNTSTALSIDESDPIRGMQVVMEERAKRRREKAAAKETAASQARPFASDEACNACRSGDGELARAGSDV